ncbi:hypothetical protein HOF40_02255 [Candidatus Parcubacteria bacterium]|nr:hypothetical protein [Candidatus Parcubacteria bacterium]MBT3948887.1 hypothetical protein [Candidatus Parcubacteria bacterium]
MDKLFAIRAGIFLIAGLLMILFPKKIYKFQTYLLKKLHIKYDPNRGLKSYFYIGGIFIIISILLLIVSIAK